MRFEVQAILFDIDGTLVDSTPAVERAWTTLAERHGIDPERILRVCHGVRAEDTIARFLPESEREAAAAELRQLELADLGSVVALPGAAELVSALPAERWAAVTSGGRELMRARLAAGSIPLPRVLIAAEDVSVGKPDPEGYRKAAEELGWDIRQCLVIEDAPAGIEAGLAAGAATLAVATSHPPEELARAHAVAADLASCRLEVASAGLAITA